MAVDLGSTNFRVCSVNLRGDTTYSSKQLKTPNPRKIMIASLATEIFSLSQSRSRHLSKHITANTMYRYQEVYIKSTLGISSLYSVQHSHPLSLHTRLESVQGRCCIGRRTLTLLMLPPGPKRYYPSQALFVRIFLVPTYSPSVPSRM